MRNPAGDDAVERMLTQIEDLLKRQQGAPRTPPPLDPGHDANYAGSDTLSPRRDLREQAPEAGPRQRGVELSEQQPADAGAGYDPASTQQEVAPYDPDEVVREIREMREPAADVHVDSYEVPAPPRSVSASTAPAATGAPPSPAPQTTPANEPGAATSTTGESSPAAVRPAPSEERPSRPQEPAAAPVSKPAASRSEAEPAAAAAPVAPPVPTSRKEAPTPSPAAAPPPAASGPVASASTNSAPEMDEGAADDPRGGHPNGTHMTRRLTTRLGQMLTDANLLTEEQLQAALRKQQHTGERLGAVLINEGFVDEPTLLSVLESQYGVPAVDLDETELDPALVKLIPLDMARRNLIVPLAVHNDAVDVAMVDPTDFVAMAHVRFSAGLRPNVFITTVQAARRAIARLYVEDEDAGIPEEPLDRRQAIKRMILDRDSMLMAADQDPRKFYQLAATIDAFVDEILRKADRER